MTRLLKFVSVLFLIFLVVSIILGLFVRPNTYFTRAVVIESPINVVWRHLLDHNNYQIWQKGVKRVVLNSGTELWEGAVLRFHYMDYEGNISHEERIAQLEPDNQIVFLREGLNENPLLKNFKTTYLIKRLQDGSTEITVSVSYSTSGFVTRIYNQPLSAHGLCK